jgi:hypothetical protein
MRIRISNIALSIAALCLLLIGSGTIPEILFVTHLRAKEQQVSYSTTTSESHQRLGIGMYTARIALAMHAMWTT